MTLAAILIASGLFATLATVTVVTLAQLFLPRN